MPAAGTPAAVSRTCVLSLAMPVEPSLYPAMPATRLAIAALNAFDQPTFTEVLAGIYEHSPWIPERTWARRPFAGRAALAQALADTLAAASPAEQLGLIRAHPELAG